MIRIIPIFLIVLLLSSCGGDNQKKLYIAATTDVHGVIFGKDPASGEELRYSLSKISGFIKEFDTHEVLLLDNGDNIQGTPAVYYYNFEKTDIPHIWPRVLNYMSYDAITVGNHDIEAGHAVYDRIRKELNAPMLAANAVKTENGEPYFEPYTIIRKNGLRIAVLGLITPGVPGWLPEVLYEGMEFEDMLSAASKWMPRILEEEPDLVVGLFHSGWNESYGGGEPGSNMNENASLAVAREVPGFDVIFIGHDHDLMNDYVVSNKGDSILVLDGGSHSRFISLAEIEFTGSNNPRIRKITGSHIKTDSLAVDKEFEIEFASDFSLVSDYIKRPIGYLGRSLSTRDAYFGDSEFMDLIHMVQLESSGADISFAAPLSFDVSIDTGTLKVDDMFDLYRYENMLYTIELSGQEIIDYLEYSSSLWFNTLDGNNRTILKYQPGSDTRLLNRYYNFDSAAGIEYTVNLKNKEGSRVNIRGMSDGSGFYADSVYSVALNSYRGSGGGGHLSRGCGLTDEEIDNRLIRSTDKDLRYYMMKWIEKKGSFKIRSDNNWVLLPENEVERLSGDESRRLFNED